MARVVVKNGLSSLLFGRSRTRRAILSLLFGHTERSYYLRQIARASGFGLGPVQRELKLLGEAGVVTRSSSGNQVHYRANAASPVFSELRSLIAKTVGAADTLRTALEPLVERIAVAFVYGSVARGEESPRSDIDVMVVGSASFSDVVDALGRAEETLAREVNPTVYPVDEFLLKVAGDHYFIREVLSGVKIFLIGDERELEQLVRGRLAGQS